MQAMMEHGHGHGAPREDAGVWEALEPDQLVEARREPYGRRQLSAGALAAMWGLRIYALLMVLVVIYSVVLAVHTGG
jgi:hypothetical protein